MKGLFLLSLLTSLCSLRRLWAYGIDDPKTLGANVDFTMEESGGTYTYEIMRDKSSTEQYVSIVAIDGDSQKISMECSDGVKVQSDAAQNWFYAYGLGDTTVNDQRHPCIGL